MLSFTELLTATDSDLVKIFYKITVDENDDFIGRNSQISLTLTQTGIYTIMAHGFQTSAGNYILELAHGEPPPPTLTPLPTLTPGG